MTDKEGFNQDILISIDTVKPNTPDLNNRDYDISGWFIPLADEQDYIALLYEYPSEPLDPEELQKRIDSY